MVMLLASILGMIASLLCVSKSYSSVERERRSRFLSEIPSTASNPYPFDIVIPGETPSRTGALVPVATAINLWAKVRDLLCCCSA
jgi:hypothetical protein